MMPTTIGREVRARETGNVATDACRLFALTGVDIARAEMDRMASQTDAPDWRDVKAADYLDAAHALLARCVSP
jgi:hypothetical protein